MCKIHDVTNCEKKIKIVLKNGQVIKSDWFEDKNKISVANAVNSTEEETYQLNTELEKRALTLDDISEWSICRKKEEDELYISEHAFQRAKERLGWNKKTMIRMMKKVYDEGIADKDVKGALAPWIKSRMARYDSGERSILYGNMLFVLSRNMVVTVVNVPTKTRVENKICGKSLSSFEYAEAV